ncbi:hypothetical protein ACFYNL_25825 [Streptomyces sp. NPDC007808]|uniref:hypothetical protein n=1 Tax=Streptomyces sp. NPDC007808 TaxID=3364779 RepID=UPI0036ACA6BB
MSTAPLCQAPLTTHGGPCRASERRARLTGWHDRLVARRGRDCNHAWPGQVPHIALPNGWDDLWNLPPEEEQHAIRVLFELLDEFAAECEAAQGTRS